MDTLKEELLTDLGETQYLGIHLKTKIFALDGWIMISQDDGEIEPLEILLKQHQLTALIQAIASKKQKQKSRSKILTDERQKKARQKASNIAENKPKKKGKGLEDSKAEVSGSPQMLGTRFGTDPKHK